jgi:putative transposase
MDHLPDKLKDQTKAVMKASWKLNAKEGMEEMFTLNHLGLPPTLTRCLATTNIIESPNGGVRRRTRRVNRLKNVNMVLRWAVSAFLSTEKNFRKIMGYKDLWTLEAILGRLTVTRIDKYKKSV